MAEPVRCPDGKTAVLAPPLHEHAAKTAFPVNPAVRGAVEGAGAGEAQVVRTSDKKSLFAPFPQLARAVSSRGALKCLFIVYISFK